MVRQLKLLIVEGNTKEARDHAVSFGMLTQSANYAKTLKAIRPDLKIDFIFPTDGELPGHDVDEISAYDGIVFTGSSLHTYDTDADVLCQIELMKACFSAGSQIFGSEMQAIAMNIGTAEFWGVQYHPEFDLSYIAGVFRRYAEMMLNEGFVASPADLEQLIGDYTRLQEVGDTGLAWRYGLGADVLDSCSRTQEIANWLEKISALDK